MEISKKLRYVDSFVKYEVLAQTPWYKLLRDPFGNQLVALTLRKGLDHMLDGIRNEKVTSVRTVRKERVVEVR